MLNVGDYVRGLAQHDLHAAVRQGEDELARSGLQLGDIVACGLEQRERFLFQTALGECDTHGIPAGRDLGTARACKALRDALHVNAEAARGHILAELGAQRVVTAACEDGRACAADVAAEHDAGVVIHLVNKAEVDHDAIAVACLIQCLIQSAQISGRAEHAHVAGERLDLVEHLDAAEQIRHSAERLCGGLALKRLERITERGKRLVFDQAADALGGLCIRAKLIHQRLVDLSVTKLYAEVVRAGLAECGKRSRENILVGLQTVRADKFRADLQELALVAVVAGHRTEHLLAVIQADRQRRVIQSGGCNTRDRRGVIRTRHANAAGLVDDLQHLILIQLGVCLCKYIKILNRRGDDLAVSALLQRVAHSIFRLPQRTARGK